MASSLDYVQYVASQLAGAGVITYKKLFGEYGLWCGGKFFGTVEENQFYVKITEAGHRMLPDAKPTAPHGGRLPDPFFILFSVRGNRTDH